MCNSLLTILQCNYVCLHTIASSNHRLCEYFFQLLGLEIVYSSQTSRGFCHWKHVRKDLGKAVMFYKTIKISCMAFLWYLFAYFSAKGNWPFFALFYFIIHIKVTNHGIIFILFCFLLKKNQSVQYINVRNVSFWEEGK